MKFKKGDIVRCIDITNPVIKTVRMLIVGEIYLVACNILHGNSMEINTEFGKFSKRYKNYLGKFHCYRFKKVSSKMLKINEKFISDVKI